MRSLETEVLVIGGGATGAGVLWNCALRGFDAVLVERGDLAEGTSGRFHGLLHSGVAGAAPGGVVCDTDTCRWQIQQATGVETVHPVDVLHRAYGLG